MPEFLLKIHQVYDKDDLFSSKIDYSVKILMRMNEDMLDLNYGTTGKA
ncbi:hypothetical protein MKO06_11370 [Gramella sp. GC03-9]|uniref:Uncharacterized protein n=1 Tax=Christiangramia oceanisediminis TaxID=2920386 RepID=A0A9X2R8W8_9FLAO|nr:hypothetical protein [Gramella oceanisediminis]MCP9200513.1 hypothetical protein [Gramella oceanisediminis]